MKKMFLLLFLLVLSLPVVHAYSLSYDGRGNLISGDGFYREYDSFNHLVRVYSGDTASIPALLENYTWDYAKERVFIKDVYFNGTLNESVFYWTDTFQTVKNSSGTFDFTYVYQNGELISMQDFNGKKFFYHNDHKGSVQMITDEFGNTVDRTFYEPFGAIVSGGATSRFTYEG